MGETDTATGQSDVTTYSGPLRLGFLTSIAIGMVLIAANVAAMVVVASTSLLEVPRWLFDGPVFAPATGILVVIMGLVLGHHFGSSGLRKGKTLTPILGAICYQLTYALVGGGLLSLIDRGAWQPGLTIATAVAVTFPVACAVVVYQIDLDFSSGRLLAMGLLIGGFVVIAAGILLDQIIVVGLGVLIFLLGCIAYLLYDIWRGSDADRNPILNGFAIYVAAAGVFVHVLLVAVLVLDAVTVDQRHAD